MLTDKEYDRCFWLGYEAYFDRTPNPFLVGSEKATAWHDGYDLALSDTYDY